MGWIYLILLIDLLDIIAQYLNHGVPHEAHGVHRKKVFLTCEIFSARKVYWESISRIPCKHPTLNWRNGNSLYYFVECLLVFGGSFVNS